VSQSLLLRNRQRARPVDLAFLRRMIKALLRDHFKAASFDLGIYLIGAPEMTRLNETFLQHKGSTDVITFDYSETVGAPFHAEIFICVDEALRQARQFKTTWQSELARYLIHGLLHLDGHDDLRPAARRKMKLEENFVLRNLAGQFDLTKISMHRKKKPGTAETLKLEI
jgi:probable rRNA maturation factor